MEKDNFLWQYLKHEDNLFTNRVNHLLLAESILVISFVASLTISDLGLIVGFFIMVVGIVCTVLYRQVLKVHVFCIDKLKDEFKEKFPYFKEVKEKIDEVLKDELLKEKSEETIRRYANKRLGIWLPNLFLLSWGIFVIIWILLVLWTIN